MRWEQQRDGFKVVDREEDGQDGDQKQKDETEAKIKAYKEAEVWRA